MEVTKKLWQPIVNCGLCAGDLPSCFISSFVGFETKEECEKWIEKNQDNFTMNELGGCVSPLRFVIGNPTIIDSDENVIESYDEDDEPFGDISDDRLAELAVQFIEEHEILAEFVAYVNRNK